MSLECVLENLDFTVVDVETANADLASICQIGIATFHDGKLADKWVSLVNPEDDFSSINVSIHGIDYFRVKDAPNWAGVLSDVTLRLQNKVVVSHTAFDRLAVTRACGKVEATICECTWLDSARVVRRAWPAFSKSGYGLSNMAAHFGIEYQAHDALEDARCAGELLLLAIAETGLNVSQWVIRTQQPIDPTAVHGYRRDGNPDGELFGEVLVFTARCPFLGTTPQLPRQLQVAGSTAALQSSLRYLWSAMKTLGC
jgi:DNA polymerase III subunit epsilon